MIILHFSAVSNNPYSGVSVAIPQHIYYQQSIAQVALWNINHHSFDHISNVFYYDEMKRIIDLPKPFNSPDIVVIHQTYHPENLLIMKQTINQRIPYVLVPHGDLTDEAQSIKSVKKRLGNFFVFNRLIYNASIIQCLSASELKNISFINEKFIGTNGVESPKVLNKLKFGNEIRITYIGRMDVYIKGLDLLFNALLLVKDELLKRGVSVHLYGPDSDKLSPILKKKRISTLVNLHSAVIGKQKEEVLLSTDFFIQTSRSEGMPMGILEALSYGIPCLVTNGTTLGTIIKNYNAGWSCEGEAISIAKTLITAVDEIRRDFLQLSLNAKKLVEKNYLWGEVTAKTIEVYQKVIEKTQFHKRINNNGV